LRKKKKFFIVVLLVVVVAAVVSFVVAAISASVTVGITGGGDASFVEVTAFGDYLGLNNYPSLPSWKPYRGAVGGPGEAGDLYYLEPISGTGDAMAFVYLTNAGNLAGCYSFLHMGLNLYKNITGTTWVEADGSGPDEWLTLTSGRVILPLATGVVTYAIAIEEASWYRPGACTGDGKLSPDFHVHVIPR